MPCSNESQGHNNNFIFENSIVFRHLNDTLIFYQLNIKFQSKKGITVSYHIEFRELIRGRMYVSEVVI